jgi:hypothetical protein
MKGRGIPNAFKTDKPGSIPEIQEVINRASSKKPHRTSLLTLNMLKVEMPGRGEKPCPCIW